MFKGFSFLLAQLCAPDRWQKGLSVILGAACTWAFGPAGKPAATLAFTMIAFDTGTGLLKGSFLQALKSEVSWAGVKQKLAQIAGIAFCHQVDALIGTGNAAMSAFAYIVACHEAVSVLQNLTEAGLQMPGLLKALTTLLDQKEEGVVTDLSVLSKPKEAHVES